MRVLFAVLLFACSKPAPPTATPDPTPPVAASTAAPPAATTIPDITAKPNKPTPKVTCSADKECTISCALGAVNAKWWDAWDKDGECKDGCQEMNQARCQKGRCVAVRHDGKIDKTCTISP